MKTKWSFLKFFWGPGIIFCGLISFASYMAWKEYKINSMLIKEALEGNQIAIAILGKYEKPWKLDEKVVNKALQDNQYALQILGIDAALIECKKNQPSS